VWKVDCQEISQITKNQMIVPNTTLKFDEVFDEDTNTETVYASLAKRVISSTISGVNGTIFTYGQTSSGKTYTMRGIVSRAIQDIFQFKASTDRRVTVHMSYVEIYNEVIRDLLNPTGTNLKIHENAERGVFIGGLKEFVVESAEQIQDLLETGEAKRHVSATQMNDKSSRSHTILRLLVESTASREIAIESKTSCNDSIDSIDDNESAGGDSSISREESTSFRGNLVGKLVACLHLVDLAGSERQTHTKAEGMRLKEGVMINKSLLTLASVINKLSTKSPHIPYRDSKLTRMLQPALGGNNRTTIIACITPASMHLEESLSTLAFASRAGNVQNRIKVNEVLDEKQVIKRLQDELSALKRKFNLSEESPPICQFYSLLCHR